MDFLPISPPSVMTAPKSCFVVLRNISPECKEQDLVQLFSSFGLLVKVSLSKESDAINPDGSFVGGTRGAGANATAAGDRPTLLRCVAQFDEVEDAAAAIDNLHGATYFGRTVLATYDKRTLNELLHST